MVQSNRVIYFKIIIASKNSSITTNRNITSSMGTISTSYQTAQLLRNVSFLELNAIEVKTKTQNLQTAMALCKCCYLPQCFLDFIRAWLLETFVQSMKIHRCRLVFCCNNIPPETFPFNRSCSLVVDMFQPIKHSRGFLSISGSIISFQSALTGWGLFWVEQSNRVMLFITLSMNTFTPFLTFLGVLSNILKGHLSLIVSKTNLLRGVLCWVETKH